MVFLIRRQTVQAASVCTANGSREAGVYALIVNAVMCVRRMGSCFPPQARPYKFRFICVGEKVMARSKIVYSVHMIYKWASDKLRNFYLHLSLNKSQLLLGPFAKSSNHNFIGRLTLNKSLILLRCLLPLPKRLILCSFGYFQTPPVAKRCQP